MSREFRVGFCVSGGGKLFRAAVNAAEALGINPALLVGEGKCDSSLFGFAEQRHIEWQKLDATDRPQFDRQLVEACVNARLDLLCLTFDRIVPPQLIAEYAGRIINVHMGLLPAFKGRSGLQQALAFGARFAGATIHEVTEDVDSGAIVAQCVVGLRYNEQEQALGKRVFGNLRLMFLQVLAWYAAGRVFKDGQGRIWVKGAVYGELPISPSIEDAFTD